MPFAKRTSPIFGPTRAAAQLESSKDFAKAFMQRHGLPTAQYRTFTDARAAHAYVAQRGAPIVVKADGLAAGKGVVVGADAGRRPTSAIDAMLVDNAMGGAGARVVIEDFLEGEEASFIVMVDGRHVLPLASSQDHKRLQRRRPGSEHRRHGRLFAGADRHARACTRGSCARSSRPPSTAWPRTACRTRASSTPA